ncbi:hypothetical protein NL676_016675 [Syzygium grande]|nr:hypothetical protein NL676_016675 [Syzygium grande]
MDIGQDHIIHHHPSRKWGTLRSTHDAECNLTRGGRGGPAAGGTSRHVVTAHARGWRRGRVTCQHGRRNVGPITFRGRATSAGTRDGEPPPCAAAELSPPRRRPAGALRRLFNFVRPRLITNGLFPSHNPFTVLPPRPRSPNSCPPPPPHPDLFPQSFLLVVGALVLFVTSPWMTLTLRFFKMISGSVDLIPEGNVEGFDECLNVVFYFIYESCSSQICSPFCLRCCFIDSQDLQIPTTRARSPKLGRKKSLVTTINNSSEGGGSCSMPRLNQESKSFKGSQVKQNKDDVATKMPLKKAKSRLTARQKNIAKETEVESRNAGTEETAECQDQYANLVDHGSMGDTLVQLNQAQKDEATLVSASEIMPREVAVGG